ncbi:Hsp20/alpha crystallin family protein [Chiayiivirga flava]|uniref:HSP20 family protein n=1 Tax=Chiayiivirga flava TaxID=659595 RepID=A0A7W8D546_9GAMM|nr:Hsp20/alpha crystallin family protein [Chiayiivirga flava]MBB5206970.1 HSP20 family protein [Chiayiivirga flava]
MNTIRYGSPFNARSANDLRQIFDRFFGEAEGDTSNVATSQWTPRVDIREDETRFVIFADIPGVDPANVEVHMDKGVLTIKGERSAEVKEEGKRWSRVERAHGSFHRRFALPDSADADNITATGKHGVLEISIPKKAEQQPRRIQVQ